MKNLAQEIAAALGAVIPQDCPIKEKPAAGVKTHTLPDTAKNLVLVWFRYKEKAQRLITDGTSGNDGGVWFRRHNEVDALMSVICNVIRTERKLSYRYRFDFFADWQYSEDGA